MMRMRMLAGGVSLVCLSISATELAAQAQWQAELLRGSALLRSRKYGDAGAVYTLLLQNLPLADSADRAAAYFGRGYAVQQGLVESDSAAANQLAKGILEDYAASSALRAASYTAPAANNSGIVFRRLGRHRDALAAFLQAATTSTSVTSVAYRNAGREYEALEMPDSAAAAYRRAREADPHSAEALRALFAVYRANGQADSIIAIAARWKGDSATATAVSDALVDLLRTAEVKASNIDSALVLLARTWPVMRIGPDYFDQSLKEPIESIAKTHPHADAVLEVYRARAPRDKYVERGEAGWWRAWRGDPRDPGRRGVWSSVLRSMGDWYRERGAIDIARSYYEAAVGWPDYHLYEGWADMDALLPLALIIAQDEGNDKATQELSQKFSDAVFDAKGRAYAANDYDRVRRFHLTLGAYYAARGQWSGEGARNAIFQLEHMRMATQRLAAMHQPVADPPELLEQLAVGYKVTGRQADATRTIGEAKQRYEAQNRLDDARGVATRVQQQSQLRKPMQSGPVLRPPSQALVVRPTSSEAARTVTPTSDSARVRDSLRADSVRRIRASAAQPRADALKRVLVSDSAKADSLRRAREDSIKRARLDGVRRVRPNPRG